MKFVLFVCTVVVFLVVAAVGQSPSPSPSPYNGRQVESTLQMLNDNDVLNYALTLEHLEAAFYRMGQQKFSERDFIVAGFSAGVYGYINLIRDHEAAHVTFLTNTLRSRNASAVQECVYNFAAFYANVSTYLAAAMLLENTGVMAYDGAANAITDAVLLTAAATVATTEARHATFLNKLNMEYAFNNDSFDRTMTPAQINATTAPLFVSCPYNRADFPLPVDRATYDYTLQAPTTAIAKREFGQLRPRRAENTAGARQNDNDLLNYALHLEQFGFAFYTAAANKFNQGAFANAGYNTSVHNHFNLIVLHEVTHTNYIRSVLQARNSSLIVQPCTYNLDAALASVQSVLMTARMLENLEVTAYDGAISTISDEALVQAAATIATIEARHAAYLNQLLLNQPILQQSVDDTNSPLQILNITAPFFRSCPQQVPIPRAFYLFNVDVPQPAASPVPTPATLGVCRHPDATRERAEAWLTEVKCDHNPEDDIYYQNSPFVREYSMGQNLVACSPSDSTLGDCSGSVLFYHTCKPLLGRADPACRAQNNFLAANVTFTCDQTKAPTIACFSGFTGNLQSRSPAPCPSSSNRPTHF